MNQNSAAIRQIDQDLWEATAPFSLMGMPFGVRMTVVRLPGGDLILHSPIEITPALRAALDDLGSVRHVICPNNFHHLFAKDYSAVYPSASFYIAPGLEKRRSDLAFAQALQPVPELAWAGVMDQARIEGVPAMNETVFFHRKTRTLIVTDLVFNLPSSTKWVPKLLLTLNGIEGRFGPSRIFRSSIRDKGALKASIARILEWRPERVVMSHGAVVEKGGGLAIKNAFSLL